MRLLTLIVVAVAFVGGDLLAQTTNLPVTTAVADKATNAADEKGWSFSASLYTYFVPGSREYLQPTFTADKDWLHLETRYNYEGLDTGSAWIGYNFSFGDKVTLELTPMVGGVFGDINGVAPGYEYTLSWWKLELYSEGEFVFDTGDFSESFFYTWSELSLSPVDWFRFGLVVQRTKLYETEFEVQRGFLLGLTHKKLDFTTYMFNPDASRPTWVLAVGLSF